MATTTNGIISRQEVQQSLHCYQELLKSTSKYYRKYLELAQCANEFSHALDLMAKCKGAEQSGVGLKAAAELHQQIAKQQEQLAECLHKDFELPLQRNLVTHQKRVEENEKTFEKTMKKMQDEISKTENKMLKGRKKDLVAFQQSLQDMQRQAQEMEKVKVDNLDRMLQDEQKNLMFLVQKAAGIVKNEYDHYSSLSALSRDATEEIISIAFAPAGKQLDAQEKRRVVDKFLGAASALTVSNSRDSILSTNSGSPAPATMELNDDSLSNDHVTTAEFKSKMESQQTLITPPTTPTSNALQNVTETIPPTMARSNSIQQTSTIQESLRRLNLAAAQVQNQRMGSSASETSATPAAASRSESAVSTSVQMVAEEKEETASVVAHKVSSGQPPAPVHASATADLVIAVHDFTGRTERELSFKKNDVMFVKQRQENWLYATHYPIQTPAKSGWIPVSYTAKHTPQ